MFTTRLISGIVLVIIAAFLLVEGSAVLYFGSMAISLIGLYELYRVMKIERSAPGFVGYAAVVAYYWIMGNREQYVTFLAIISRIRTENELICFKGEKNQYGQYLKDVMDGKYQEHLY